MVDDGLASKDSSKKAKGKKKKKKNNKRGGGKKKVMTIDQALALKAVNEWVHLGQPSSSLACGGLSDDDDFGVQRATARAGDKLVFDLHSHSKFSDGFLSPTKLVERAYGNGVKVLALTDHDTMSGIPEAIEAARRFNIKIIPGVEVSTVFSARNSEADEPVHILAYYSSCGPTRFEELEKFLANIRDGRYLRAKDIVSKLNRLKLPLKWEHVVRIAGKGVAPGRLHVARAMVEAGYVENLKQAFARYLYDGGPAYSMGSEPFAGEAIKLIRETGGLAVLAHPWALKDPVAVVKHLKEAGLHGMEVYRSDGKLAVYSDLADTYGLLKLGGSDYHARGGNSESELGSVNLPVLAVHEFLNVARPIWRNAIKDILYSYVDEPSDLNLAQITRFGKMRILKGNSPLNCGKDLVDRCLSLWLTSEERHCTEFEAIRIKLSHVEINHGGTNFPAEIK
uniref:3' 5'-nucleoside bisphosphate phosphatase n=1 Tax=Rhizophora mucronata TaxID=61149 RepID=A0A2P2JCF3_RHIMU